MIDLDSVARALFLGAFVLFAGVFVLCAAEALWYAITTPKYERPADSKTYRP